MGLNRSLSLSCHCIVSLRCWFVSIEGSTNWASFGTHSMLLCLRGEQCGGPIPAGRLVSVLGNILINPLLHCLASQAATLCLAILIGSLDLAVILHFMSQLSCIRQSCYPRCLIASCRWMASVHTGLVSVRCLSIWQLSPSTLPSL